MNDTWKGGKGLLYGDQKTPTGVVQHLCVALWFLGTLFAHTGSFLAETTDLEASHPTGDLHL